MPDNDSRFNINTILTGIAIALLSGSGGTTIGSLFINTGADQDEVNQGVGVLQAVILEQEERLSMTREFNRLLVERLKSCE